MEGLGAITVHKVLSIGCRAPVDYYFNPAREHDSRHPTIDASLGCGLRADLTYASLARLPACNHLRGVLCHPPQR